MRRHVLIVALAAAWLAGTGLPSLAQPARHGDAAVLGELRRSFTLHGKPVPPEIFRDFGDGDLADSGSIWITVDLAAAIGSNRYADAIRKDGAWLSQSRPNQSMNGKEETAYMFVGAADNGLLVVVASYNGGGSGTFYTLHILDAAVTRGFGPDGKRVRRVGLTVLRGVALGDRWDGAVSLAHNAVRVVTTQSRAAAAGGRTTRTIAAERP